MNIKEKKADGLVREFEVAVPAQEIETRVSNALQKMKNQVNIPGFRPGKVPDAMMRQRYAGSARQDVLQEYVQEASDKLLKEKNYRLALAPALQADSYKDGGDFKFTLVFELLPELEKIPFKDLKLQKWNVAKDEAKLEEMLKELSKRHRSSEPVKKERAAAKGDVAVIDFEGFIDGVAFPGGAGKGHHLELGAGQFIEGFEPQVEGMNVNEERDIVVTFPKEYHAKELAGKPATFKVTLQEVRTSVDSKIDDELAKKLGFPNLEGLRRGLENTRVRDFEKATRTHLKKQILDQLDKLVETAVPPSLLQRELESIIVEHIHEEHPHDHSEECNHELDPKEREKLEKEYRPVALRRVRLGLVLAEIARHEKIAITNPELDNAIRAQMMQFPGQEKMVLNYYKENPQAIAALKAPLLEEKVIDFIINNAKLEEKEVAYEKLVKELDA